MKYHYLLLKLLSVFLFIAPQALMAAPPELPRFYVNVTHNPPVGGRTIAVRAGDHLQNALDSALPGDILELEAGATFTGDFALRAKGASTNWIYIRSSKHAELPQPGKRVGPQHAHLMPKIVASGANPWGIRDAESAGYYRLVGIEITKNATDIVTTDLVRFGVTNDGSNQIEDINRMPHDIIFDRVYVHGQANQGTKRGIRLDGARMAVVDSYISDIHYAGFDSQAVVTINGPGPYKIVNNFLEAAGENFMSGGGDPSANNLPIDHPARACNGTGASCGLVPSDFEIRSNHFYKPLSWKYNHPSFDGRSRSIKNLFELKNGQRVLVDGNIFENNWAAGQDGAVFNIKSSNNDGRAPWSVSRHVTITNNILRNCNLGIKVNGRGDSHPAGRTTDILISNNLMYNINASQWGTGTPNGAPFEIANNVVDIKVDHNTIDAVGSHLIVSAGMATTGFVFTNNITTHNIYGIKGDGADNMGTLTQYFPGYDVRHNAVYPQTPMNLSTFYPPLPPNPPYNFFPTNIADIKYINRSIGDYRLAEDSPYRAGARLPDGSVITQNLGADIGLITTLTRCVITGDCEISSSPPRIPNNLRLKVN